MGLGARVGLHQSHCQRRVSSCSGFQGAHILLPRIKYAQWLIRLLGVRQQKAHKSVSGKGGNVCAINGLLGYKIETPWTADKAFEAEKQSIQSNFTHNYP